MSAAGIEQSRGARCKGRAVTRAAQHADAGCAQLRMLVRSSRRADARSAQPLRVLDRLEADATRRGLHDDGEAGTELRALERHMRRAPCDGQRARLLKGE